MEICRQMQQFFLSGNVYGLGKGSDQICSVIFIFQKMPSDQKKRRDAKKKEQAKKRSGAKKDGEAAATNGVANGTTSNGASSMYDRI